MSISNRSVVALTGLFATLAVAATGCDALNDLAHELQAKQNGGAAPPPTPTPECGTDAECRTFSNDCDGCACDALAKGEKDPVCGGTIVQCLIDPCQNSQAVCKAGQCVVAAKAPPKGEPCGVTTCAAGMVCCNPSCGICTPPGGVCVQIDCSPGQCASDADCRTFSNYCDGCACDVLPVSAPDPVCGGTIVQCFVDPCFNTKATCSGGKCVPASPPAAPQTCEKRTQGGPTSCKDPGTWKTYASDDCKQSGLVLSEISLREDCGGGNSRFVDYVCCVR